MDKLRLRFRKVGRAVYISHLDLMKMIQRAFSRAGLDLKYSEGYNPRPQISIALPLSVGTASVCELMDFKLKADVELKELPARLTAVLPEGIEIIEAYEPQRKASAIKWIEVTALMEYDERDAAEIRAALREFFEREKIVITKRTKRGMGEVDIKPAIKSIAFEEADGCVSLRAVISAQNPTLNPELLTEALRVLAPEIAPDFAKYTRVEVYDADMKVFR